MKTLTKLAAQSSFFTAPKVDFKLKDDCLEIIFTVKKPKDYQWNVARSFHLDDPRKNWSLWEYDVVEAFIQSRKTPKDHEAFYWEFQLSALGQGLILGIERPRKQYWTPLSCEVDLVSRLDDCHWQASFRIPLGIFKTGELYGNFYSVLGKVAQREYFAWAPVRQEPLDFHAPELFKSLEL